MEISIGLIVWVIVLVATVKLATSRGRSQLNWLFLVLFFPPAFLILVYLPNRKTGKKVPASDMDNLEHLRRCLYCKNIVSIEKEVCSICLETG